MAYHKFTLGGCSVEGFRVDSGGNAIPFSGSLRNHYKDLARASCAARRKYKDPTITLTKIVDGRTRYRVDLEALLAISEKMD